MSFKLGRSLLLAAAVSAGVVGVTVGPAAAAPHHQVCNGDTANGNGHGANQSGPYDNTCPAGESQNGNGNGNANGRPCAGCVGNADDKNPAGQLPGPEDANNGYECDANNGIGKSNPAHTGCEDTPPSGS